MYIRNKCAHWRRQLLSVQSHLQGMESTVKRKDICLALCFGELLFMTNTHKCAHVISNTKYPSFTWLPLQVTVVKRGWESLREAEEHRKGVSGAWSWECMLFLIPWEVGDVARYPRKCSSHTKGLANMRTAKISQRHGTEAAEAKTSSSDMIKSQCRYLGVHS